MSGETALRRPRTASREVRRRQLIEATIESIATHGLSGTTMATVTGIADLSMGIVSFHFRSKDNLLVETLAFLAEEHRDRWMQSMQDAALTPEARLLALIDAHFHDSICTPRKLAVWFAFFGERRYRAAYRERVADIDRERAEITERLCRRLVADGGYAGLDPLAVTKLLETMTDGLWLNIMMYPGWMSPAEARRQVHDCLAATFPRHFPASGTSQPRSEA